ncbi:hypothetical protein CVU75_00115 [Candidatus Dependentiae bacterium HGW-Dependentiae-1]|nr:MAG: hypothetical protein CVU75_00115 [Candidatus Dependentiae bacterium HGW-Dependentiae-1]
MKHTVLRQKKTINYTISVDIFFCSRAFFLLFCIIFLDTFWTIANDNHSEYRKILLTRRYNEVAFPATHNAQSSEASSVCNQDLGISEQLNRGIRALKIHIWYDRDQAGNSVAYVCHGMNKDFLSKSYLDQVADKVPRLFRPFARDVLKQMEPLNDIIRQACRTAYGVDDAPGAIQFPHCIFDPAQRRFADFLSDISKFMQKNPREIITIILEDHTNNLEQLATEVKKVGLDRYAHSQNKNKVWPTLEQMITQNKRLVLLVHAEVPLVFDAYPWLHNLWDFAWDTEWHFDSVADLQCEKGDCMPKRGLEAFAARNQEPRNKLFIVHHFITENIGGSKSAAKKVNKRTCLHNRLKKLTEKAGHIPNIVQVDFFEYPNNDLFEVVKQINREYTPYITKT